MDFIPQRRATDCGVAALAMLCRTTYEWAERSIPWRREGSRVGTTTKQLRTGAMLLGYRTESNAQAHMQVIRAPDGWSGKPVGPEVWGLIPDNSLVKVSGDGRNWHWVVWQGGRVWDPAFGSYVPESYSLKPSSYMQFIKE